MLVKEPHDVILESVGHSTRMGAGVYLEIVRYAVYVEHLVKLACFDA